MKKEYVYYTAESHTVSPADEPLNSLQILGFEVGEDSDEALSALMMNNSWITESGFDIGKILHRTIVSDTFLPLLKQHQIIFGKKKALSMKCKAVTYPIFPALMRKPVVLKRFFCARS